MEITLSDLPAMGTVLLGGQGQRYRLTRVVEDSLAHGESAPCVVYQAQDQRQADRQVAVKGVYLGEELAGRWSPQAPAAVLAREVERLQAVSGPGVPRFDQPFTLDGWWYVAMQYIEGETLEDYFTGENELLPVDRVLEIGVQIALALDSLHTLEPPFVFALLHPHHVMRTPAGHCFLVGFGLGWPLMRAKNRFGIPGYAAPEQYSPDVPITPAADVFSLGVLLYQLLSGTDPTTLIPQVLRGEPLPFGQGARAPFLMMDAGEQRRLKRLSSYLMTKVLQLKPEHRDGLPSVVEQLRTISALA